MGDMNTVNVHVVEKRATLPVRYDAYPPPSPNEETAMIDLTWRYGLQALTLSITTIFGEAVGIDEPYFSRSPHSMIIQSRTERLGLSKKKCHEMGARLLARVTLSAGA
jgi:hypothetical protein